MTRSGLAHRAKLPRRREAGFTLVEILVVVSILAALAAIAAPIFRSVDETAGEQLANAELKRIAAALRQFKQDTGYYPKQGPFATTNDANLASPGNLGQLFAQPQDSGGSDILAWDIEAGRGWRGPYLTSFGEGEVGIGLDLAADGTGDPLAGATVVVVTAVADPFEKPPVGAYMQWLEPISGRNVNSRGRAYLYFIDDGANDPSVNGCRVPCVLSMGPNGRYDSGGGDDIVISLGGP